MDLSRKLAAEFTGTFTLIFAGVCAICVANGDLVAVALAHGLAIAVMVSAFGHVSGGHFNPAVTAGALAGGAIAPGPAVAYVLSQLAGGVAGALMAGAVMPAAMVDAAKLGTPMLGPGVGTGAGILMEAVLTFFLVTVVFGTAIDKRAPRVGGLFIGLTIVLDILAGGPISGASMNPARTFGPALAGGYWDGHAVYWIGPLAGGVAAGFVYSRFIGREGMSA